MAVSGAINCQNMAIYGAINRQNMAISGAINSQKGRQILYRSTTPFIKNLSTILAIYGPINWTILAIYGPRNKLEPFWLFMVQEIANSLQFMAPETAPFWLFLQGSEIAKMVQFLGPETASKWLFLELL